MVKLSKDGRNAENWGGARRNAGRKRTDSLDAVECLYLADLLEREATSRNEQEAFAPTVEKLRKMAQRITETGRMI